MGTGRIRLLEAPLPKSDEEEDWREIGSIDPVTGYSTPDLPWRAAQRSFPCNTPLLVQLFRESSSPAAETPAFTRREKPSAYRVPRLSATRDELLELVERVRPAVPVELAARLGLKRDLE
jgi:hypothetical protein